MTEKIQKPSTMRLVLGILLTGSILLIFILSTLIVFVLLQTGANEIFIRWVSYISNFLYLLAVVATPLGIYLLVTQKNAGEPLPEVEGRKRGTATIGAILTDSKDVFLKNIKIFALLSIIFYLPINFIVEFLLTTQLVQQLFQNLDGIQAVKLYTNIGRIFYGTIGLVVLIATIFITSKTLEEEDTKLGTSIKIGFKKWLPAFGTSLLFGICVLGLTLLFIIPGIIFAIFWLFYLRIVVLKNISGFEALSYSKKIVKDRWGQIFGYTLIFGLLGILLGGIIGLIYGFGISPYITNPHITLFADILFGVFIDFIGIFFVIVFTVFFIRFDFTENISELEEKQNNDKIIELAE